MLSVARSTALCQASPTLTDRRYHARLLMLRQRAVDTLPEEQRAVMSTLVMLLGAMGGMTNGAVVQLWSALRGISAARQKPPDTARENGPSDLPAALTVHSIGMQSVTMPEFFYRCSPDWPQMEEAQMLHHRDIPSRAWRSMILNMDEGYEFPSASALALPQQVPEILGHASTLNTVLGTGNMQRSTRSSGSYGSSNSAVVNLPSCPK